ncbi:MAG: phage Gp37/Gp68 family protein [Dehalococcoidales bacterium]|nr:phage Gp37/Gp68 family protein [Dehalococcoidales bacterium]
MAQSTTIEWTDSTWNPVTGCTKISSGCINCYAERLALRLKAMGNPSYVNGFSVTLHEETLMLPLKWKKPQTIFVNSMSDLFHEDIPVEFIFRVFDVMCRADWHNFQILTKRADRMLELNPRLTWAPHIWMGVTVEEQNYTDRINRLQKTNARVKFLSLEPLLSPIPNLQLEGIDWVIVGGESGPKARPMKKEWALDIRNQCQEKRVPFFFKQWGGINKKKTGRVLEGRTWDETPIMATSPQLL